MLTGRGCFEVQDKWESTYAMLRFLFLGTFFCSLTPYTEAGPFRYLSTPKNLWAVVVPSKVSPGYLDANLSWSHVHHKESWKPLVYTLRWFTKTGVSFSTIVAKNTPKVTDMRLNANTTYEFSVKAKQGWLSTDWSIPLHVTTTSPPMVTYKEPSSGNDDMKLKPRGLKIKYLSPTSFKLKWREPKAVPNTQNYRVTWKRKKGYRRHHVNITKRSYIIHRLKPDVTYSIKVQSIGTNGILSKPLTLFCKTSKPSIDAAPKNFTANAIGTTKIRLSWNPPNNSGRKITEYKIQYKRKGVRRGDVCSVVANPWKKSHTITDLLKGEHYKIRIAAKSGYTTGTWSDWKVVKLPGIRNTKTSKITQITTTIPTTKSPEELFGLDVKLIPGGVNITWNDISSDAVFYMLSITNGQKIVYIDEVPYGRPLVLEVYSLEPGKEFNVTVRGVGATGEQLGLTSYLFTTPVPLRMKIQGNSTVVEGQNVTLSCVVKGKPEPQYDWDVGQWFTNVSVQKFKEESFEKHIVILQLFNVKAGMPSPICAAANELESVAMEYPLDIIDLIPVPIQNISVELVSGQGIDVYWEPPYSHAYLNVTYDVKLKDGNGNLVTKRVSGSHLRFSDIFPQTNYSVTVTSVNSNGLSRQGATNYIMTPKKLPETKAHIQTLNETTIRVDWISNGDPQPVLVKVIYGPNDTSDVLERKAYSPDTTLILQDLHGGMHYKVKVVSIYNDGRSETPWMLTKTTQKPVLQEKVRPTPPADVFLIVNSSSMTIRWLPPHPEYHAVVRKYNIDIFKEDKLIANHLLDYKQRDFTVDYFDDTKEHTVYLTAVNNRGASDPIRRTYHPLSDEDISHSAVLNLRGIPTSSKSIQVEWNPPYNKRITRYLVRYRPLEYNDSNIVDEWLGPTYKSYVITGLKPFEWYLITVIPYYNEKIGNDSSFIIQTHSDVPSAPPQNVTISSINHTEVSIIWVAPPLQYRNGILTRYKISYIEEGKEEEKSLYTNGNVTEILIKDLKPGVKYFIRLSAMTVNGSGVYTNWFSFATIAYPEVKEPPGKPVNFSTSQVPYGITLKWKRPQNKRVPVAGYIVGHGRFIPEVYREVVDENTLTFTLLKLRQNNDYIVSVRAFNNYGESEPAFMVATAGDGKMTAVITDDNPNVNDIESGKGSGYDDAPRNVSLELNQNDTPSVTIRWYPPAESQGRILGYYVYFKAKGQDDWNALFEPSLYSILKNLSFDTTYYFQVKVQYMENYEAKLSKTVKIKTYSLEDTLHVLPKPSITSVFSGTTYLDVNWKPPLKDYLHVIVGFILGFGINEINENQEFIPASQRSFRIRNLDLENITQSITFNSSFIYLVPGQKYIISLAMFNEHGKSAKSIVRIKTRGLDE